MGLYTPVVYVSDFWVLRKHLRKFELNSTEEDLTVQLVAGTYPVKYLSYQEQFLVGMNNNIEMGLLTEREKDEYKRIWAETDPILFSVTAVVSILHVLFELLAFKADVSFWSGKSDLKGISVKSLYL